MSDERVGERRVSFHLDAEQEEREAALQQERQEAANRKQLQQQRLHLQRVAQQKRRELELLEREENGGAQVTKIIALLSLLGGIWWSHGKGMVKL